MGKGIADAPEAAPGGREGPGVDFFTKWVVSTYPTSSHNLVVLGMATDPDPQHSFLDIDTDSPIVESNPDGAIGTHPLVMKGGVPRIDFQQIEVLLGEFLDG
jgi:hypothetical protein